MGVPYIGFDNATLSRLPLVKPGYRFSCKKCGERHSLEGAEESTILSYRCGGKMYVGALKGRLLVNVSPDVKGEL
jgi:PHP family Zn ribbon phosphoesterase